MQVRSYNWTKIYLSYIWILLSIFTNEKITLFIGRDFCKSYSQVSVTQRGTCRNSYSLKNASIAKRRKRRKSTSIKNATFWLKGQASPFRVQSNYFFCLHDEPSREKLHKVIHVPNLFKLTGQFSTWQILYIRDHAYFHFFFTTP